MTIVTRVLTFASALELPHSGVASKSKQHNTSPPETNKHYVRVNFSKKTGDTLNKSPAQDMICFTIRHTANGKLTPPGPGGASEETLRTNTLNRIKKRVIAAFPWTPLLLGIGIGIGILTRL